MRCSLRQLAVVSSAVTLLFFCSCERHHPDELPVEKHAKPAADKHGHAGHGEKRDHSVEPSRTAPVSPTPAQFFPESTPR